MSRLERTSTNHGDENDSHDSDPDFHSVWEIPTELKSLEAKLAKLCPRDDRLNRDLLMFRAGQASVEQVTIGPGNAAADPIGRGPRSAASWFRVFTGMAALAATLLALLLTRIPSAPGVATTVISSAPGRTIPPSTAGDQNSWLLARSTLSSAPFRLRQVDFSPATALFERFPKAAKPPGTDGSAANGKASSPQSIPLLLKEAAAASFSFESGSRSPNPGTNS